MKFKGQHLLSVNDVNQPLIDELFALAEQMRPYATKQKVNRVLEGAILGNLFFEPSTRTRVSFGTAFDLLGGSVRETTGMANSALAKGESLYDTAKVLSGYSDIIAMRHPDEFSVEAFSKGSRVPVVNGGDGSNEHPTQALLDLFTIQQELKSQGESISGLKLSLIGDLKHGRTVHSLCKLLALYPDLTIKLVSPSALAMPTEYIDLLTSSNHRITQTDDLEEGLTNSNIVYQTRIQEERFDSQDEANRFRGKFRLNKSVYYSFCQKNTVIMHPLPRDSRAEANELDNDLNDESGLAIFRQTDNGILVRMALFAGILGVDSIFQQYEKDVCWQVGLT